MVQSGRPVAKQDILQILDLLPDTDMQRGDRTQVRDSESKCFITGAYIFSSMAGIRKTTSDLPSVTRCLAKYVSQLSAKHTFATVALFRNLQAKPHADAHNQEGSVNLIAPLSAFKGGTYGWLTVWGRSPGPLMGPAARVRFSMCRQVPASLILGPRHVHATDPWTGRRDVIVGFTPRDMHKLSEDDRARLVTLGLKLASPVQRGRNDAPAAEQLSLDGEVDFGVYYKPQEFLQKALEAKHPCHFDSLLPEDLRLAIKANVEMSEDALAKMRTERLRAWIAWAQELQMHEDLLKQRLPEHRKLVLNKKRLCLFRRVLQQAGHGDTNQPYRAPPGGRCAEVRFQT